MRLLVSLLLALVIVIGLSYYKNKEYFVAVQNTTTQVDTPLDSTMQDVPIESPTLDSSESPASNPVDALSEAFKTIDSTPTKRSPLSDAATPSRQDVTPQVVISDTGYTAMDLQNKSSLLKDIQQIVRQEIITSRNRPTNHPMALQSNGSKTSCDNKQNDTESCDGSDAVNQGNEYQQGKHDMSQYIKKNAIPCWGCSLDY